MPLTERLPRRLAQLLVGLVLFSFSMAMLLRSLLGNLPWDVLHQGVAVRSGLPIGLITGLVGVLALLCWIPLRERPGVGTVTNVAVIALTIDPFLALLPEDLPLGARIGLLLGGIVLNAVATAMYVGAALGPGPRDGIMTGLARRTGSSMRLVRTGIEIVVVAIGFVLGGTLGLGTLLFALAIGPLIQLMLPRFTIAPKSAPVIRSV